MISLFMQPIIFLKVLTSYSDLLITNLSSHYLLYFIICYPCSSFPGRNNCTKFFRSLSTPDDNSAFTSDNRKLHLTDIYLGGDCHMCSSWREKIAIPMIRLAVVIVEIYKLQYTCAISLTSSSKSCVGNKLPKLTLIKMISKKRDLLLYSLSTFV